MELDNLLPTIQTGMVDFEGKCKYLNILGINILNGNKSHLPLENTPLTSWSSINKKRKGSHLSSIVIYVYMIYNQMMWGWTETLPILKFLGVAIYYMIVDYTCTSCPNTGVQWVMKVKKGPFPTGRTEV